MKRIRKRQRADKLPTDIRRGGGAIGRRVYFIILFLTAFAVGNYFFGDKVRMRSEGVVKHDVVILEAPATVLVTDVLVRPGEAVRKGDPLLRLEAVESRLQISMLAERLASLKDIRYQRELSSKRAKDQLPLLREQIAARERQLETLRNLQDRGLSTQSEIDDISVELLDYRRQLADLDATAGAVFKSDDETVTLERNLVNLSELFGDGILRAPIDGKIAQDLTCIGDVATTGERLLTILHGDYYVVAYLNEQYFFDVGPGLRVNITGHQNSTTGIVEEILPYSEAKPIEFHHSLRPRGRDLLARILIDDPSGFVMDQGVTVTIANPRLEWTNRLSQLLFRENHGEPEQLARN